MQQSRQQEVRYLQMICSMVMPNQGNIGSGGGFFAVDMEEVILVQVVVTVEVYQVVNIMLSQTVTQEMQQLGFHRG